MGNMIDAAAAAGKSSGGTSYVFLLVIVAVLGLMYFVTIRPQRNRQRQAMQTQSNVVPGQRVRTTAGMYATIVAIDGNDVILEVSPGVEMRFLRRAIMEVLPDEDADGGGLDGTDETGEYADDEAESDEETYATEAAEDGHGGTTAVADTAGENQTTEETGTAPNANGKSPADEGRPAGR